MDYNHINSFLDKFKKILGQKVESYLIISLIINKYIPIKIDGSCIKVKGTVIYIKGSPMLRNEILMHKQQILKELKETLTDSIFSDIA